MPKTSGRGKPTAAVRWELIEPKYAAAILKDWNYGDNRRLREGHVAFLQRQLLGGHWLPNGETLIFDTTKHLLDGQHRLSAIVQARKSAWCLVVRGVPTEAYTTLDIGNNRSVGSTLGNMGYKNANVLAAICRFQNAWEMNREKYLSESKNMPRLSPDELAMIAETYSDLQFCASWVAGAGGIRKLGNGSLFGHLLFLLRQANEEKAMAFADAFNLGTNLGQRNPILVLRDTLMTRKLREQKTSRVQYYTLVIGAWNFYRAGKKTSRLHLTMKGRPVAPPGIGGLEDVLKHKRKR
jgi:hypothetical protein